MIRYNKYNDKSKGIYVQKRAKIWEEMELLKRIHAQVPHWTPKPVACVECFVVDKDSTERRIRRGETDIMIVDSQFHIFMAYVGESLYDISYEDISYKTLRSLLLQGVVALHSKGIVHNDIKPGNLSLAFVEDKPRLTFVDMGGACLLEVEDEDELGCPKFTGTRGYMYEDLAMHLISLKGKTNLHAYGCLSLIHDWFGVVGTLYSLKKAYRMRVLPLPRHHTSLQQRVEVFRASFGEDPIVQMILDLPGREFLAGEMTHDELCEALKALDRKVHGLNALTKGYDFEKPRRGMERGPRISPLKS